MRNAINHHQKAQIALAALKGDKTINELSQHYQVHPSKIEEWKDVLLAGAPTIFADVAGQSKAQQRIEQLQKIIGERQEEVDWLKKKLRIPESR
jgi:putative transposase